MAKRDINMRGDFEIGRILHLKSNPEIAHWTVLVARSNPIFRDFGFEMQDSSNFAMVFAHLKSQVC